MSETKKEEQQYVERSGNSQRKVEFKLFGEPQLEVEELNCLGVLYPKKMDRWSDPEVVPVSLS